MDNDKTDSLLDLTEPPAFELINEIGHSDLVLVCDHASNLVPRKLLGLGLSQAQLDDHIGWDPGSALVARFLSSHLDAPLLLSSYSRLVIDCNRAPDMSDSIPEQSGGVDIPGNRNLSAAERAMRRRELFDPYQQAIGHLLDGRRQRKTILMSIHSFTPSLRGLHRPWSIGVCFGRDARLADLLLPELKMRVSGEVGRNQPYSITDEGDYTIPVQAEARGIPSVMLEIRQDEIRTEEQAHAWGKLIADCWLEVQSNQGHS